MSAAAQGIGLTGSRRVRVIRPALHKSFKLFRRARDRMLLRYHGLKLRFWPEREPEDESGTLLDLNWSWIESLKGLHVGELRIDDKIGGHENIRIIFFEGDPAVRQPLPMIWILDVIAKKRDDFTMNDLKIFKAKRTLVIERFFTRLVSANRERRPL